jgi:hypothetical protein
LSDIRRMFYSKQHDQANNLLVGYHTNIFIIKLNTLVQ